MARMDRVERLMGPSPLDKAMERMARPPMPTAAMDVFAGRPSPMEKVMKQVGERLTRPLIPTEAMERLARPLMPPTAGEHFARPLMPPVAMDRLIARPFGVETATDRMVKRLGRRMIDTSAMNAAVGHLERTLFTSAALDRLVEHQSSFEKVLERLAQQPARPLIDTSALDRAMEHFERSMIGTSALDRAATGLGRWLDAPSPLDGALETLDYSPDPALAAALMEAARTVARKAGNVSLDSAQTGLNVAWGAFCVYMVTYTDDEISPAVYAWASLLFALLNLAARRQR